MKFWINTASRNHVLKGIEGGFTQADHGRNTRLKALDKDDFLIFYSPRTELNGGQKLQAFTAMGQILDSTPYQVEMSPTFHPWRRKVNFYKCEEVYIKNILNNLSFIKDKSHWGFPFRRGLFNIPKSDFDIISEAMNFNNS
jgi:hypothetical protein